MPPFSKDLTTLPSTSATIRVNRALLFWRTEGEFGNRWTRVRIGGDAVGPCLVKIQRIVVVFSLVTYLFFSFLGATTLIEKFGVTLVIAAGNDGQNACKSSPGRVKSALTIGASCVGADPEFCGGPVDSVASWSSFGNCVDLYAPGDYVLSGT